MQAALRLAAPLALALAYGAAGTAGRAVSEVTPVQKVVQLLNGMLTKGKEEKHEEQVQFAAYKQFCDDTSIEKKRAIADAEDSIGKLKADIEKYTADADALAEDITEHDEDISVWTGDQKAAGKVRDMEKADYEASHKDYSESIDAINRAMEVLKERTADTPQASFVQLAALRQLRLVPEEARKTIEAFLLQREGGGQFATVEEGRSQAAAAGAPEANAYEFQSNGVIGMLEQLLEKFSEERSVLEKEEVNANHAYELLMQDMDSQIEQASNDRSEKVKTKAKKLQAKASAEGNLKDTQSSRDKDKVYLDELVATCEKKANDFESRQELRSEELEAIEKAIEIISSEAVSGSADKHLPSLLQRSSSFAALRAEVRSNEQAKAAAYLQLQAGALQSRVLSAVAERAAADPFRKVRKMIKDLLVRLMEEANEEADHKGWCDTELATNAQARNEKTEAVETLRAEIDELHSSIAKLAEDITELSKGVAELDEAMSKATKLREGEKVENKQAIEDAQAAQTAVAQALTVLKEFYAKAGESTAFLQQQPEAPEVFDAPYKGMQSENGGVVGMLEVIESDFARLEADTKAAEASAQKEYDTFMTDSGKDKAAKAKDIEHKTANKQDKSQALTVKKEDLEGTQKELDAALEYFDKLKPSCVDAGVSYEDRVQRRKSEIESLQQALRILNGEDIA